MLPLKPYFYDSEFASINLNIEYHWMKYGRRHGGNHFQPFTASFEHFNVTITLSILFMLTSQLKISAATSCLKTGEKCSLKVLARSSKMDLAVKFEGKGKFFRRNKGRGQMN